MLHLAPIQPRERSQRDSFLAPNGTYYANSFPSAETAKELVELGVCRVVCGMSWKPDVHEAMQILLGAGVGVEFKR